MGKRVDAARYYSRRADREEEPEEVCGSKRGLQREEEEKSGKKKQSGAGRNNRLAENNNAGETKTRGKKTDGSKTDGSKTEISRKKRAAAAGGGEAAGTAGESRHDGSGYGETDEAADRRREPADRKASRLSAGEKAGITEDTEIRMPVPQGGISAADAVEAEKNTGAGKERAVIRLNKAGSQIRTVSPDLRSVSGNLKKAVSHAKERDRDEVRELTGKLVGMEAVAVSELKTVHLAEKMTGNAVRVSEKTIAVLSKKERQKREEYRDYYKNKRAVRTAKKNIRKWKKEERSEPEEILKNKYRMKQDNARSEMTAVRKKNKGIRKKLAVRRHTRSIAGVRKRFLSDMKGGGKELLKVPNRMTLMVSSDSDAEKITAKAGAGITQVLLKGMAEIIKAYLAALKSVMTAISPVLFVSVLIMFMMYILFFSDFESAFDLSVSREDLTGEPAENDLNGMITGSLTDRREEMAAELVAADQSVQVYFLPIPDAVISRAASLIRERASTEGNPSVLFDQWLSTEDAAQTVLQTAVCYVLPEEEEAACEEAELVAYSGNIPPPEPETEPPTEPETEPPTEQEGGITGIGAGIGIGIGMGTGNSEPEPETEPVTEPETENRAVIGYRTEG